MDIMLSTSENFYDQDEHMLIVAFKKLKLLETWRVNLKSFNPLFIWWVKQTQIYRFQVKLDLAQGFSLITNTSGDVNSIHLAKCLDLLPK